MYSSHTHTTQTSPLDQPPDRFFDQPFFGETLTLLRSVRDHDFDTRDCAGWEAWFHELFADVPAGLSPKATR